ncbi:MAG: hypothetical protein KatS3mg131_2785 [Candidatus Tectimicrobiota bacterium]|nr:MAG: hypothetical protein KatS3mg131_2785 [Candidatus Tectomicrobia bacterium]
MNDKGFTLVEVMVAIVILAFALLAVAQMQLTAMRVNAAANTLTQGMTIAQDRLERLLALPYDDADLQDDTPVGVFTAYRDPNAPAGFAVQWQVDAEAPAANHKTVNITVTQLSPPGRTFNLSFIKSNL